ncbi:MAG: hypothetical protein R3C56_26755 [Pirellulaceae bacterium]
MKQDVSPSELKKLSTFDGDEQLPDHVVLRRLQQSKARSNAGGQK